MRPLNNLQFIFILLIITGFQLKGLGQTGNSQAFMMEELDRLQKLDTFPTNFVSNKKGVAHYQVLYQNLRARIRVNDSLIRAYRGRVKKKLRPMVNGLKVTRQDFLKEQGELNYLIAIQFLNAGNQDSALYYGLKLEPKDVDPKSSAYGESNSSFWGFIGLIWLRTGEIENCLKNHKAESCILPFIPPAYHVNQEGSRNAIKYFKKSLKFKPKNPEIRWLLNIAYMTLGEYPDQVPEEFSLDLNKFDAPWPHGPFLEVAGNLGVSTNTHLGGSIMEDFNKDHLLDLFTSSFKLDEFGGFHFNLGDGSFDTNSSNKLLPTSVGGSNSIQVDYNNDGHMDIFLTRGGWLEEGGNVPNSLIRNQGKNKFKDVTQSSGLSTYHPSQTASFADFNNDGILDLFVGNESALPKDGNPRIDHYSELYLGMKDGTFEEVSEKMGIRINRYVKGAVWGDINNDGWEDLFVSCYGESNLLFLNQGKDKFGEQKFTEVSAIAGVDGLISSFPCFFFDYNNDGWLDLFVSSYNVKLEEVFLDYNGRKNAKYRPHLYLNKQDGTFKEIGLESGLDRTIYSMGLNFGDIDSDGFSDIYCGTGYPNLNGLIPNLMLRNDSARGFQDVTHATRTGHLQKGHGVAFGDIDNDGDQDLYVNIGGFLDTDNFNNVLFLNPGNDNHWINLKLEGLISNKSAIGARVTVEVIQGNKKREIHRRVGTGGSFGANSLQLEIGLGKADSISRVTVKWPASGRVQKLGALQMDSFYLINENSKIAQRFVPSSINLVPEKGGEMHKHHHH